MHPRVKHISRTPSRENLNVLKKEVRMSYGQEKIFKKLETLSLEMASALSELVNKEDESFVDPYEAIQKIKKEWSEECCRRATGEEAAEYMERFVNVMANRKEEEAFAMKIVHGTHRTLNQSFFGLMFRCIVAQANCYDAQRYDARNEASVKLCKRIVDSLGDDLNYLPFI